MNACKGTIGAIKPMPSAKPKGGAHPHVNLGTYLHPSKKGK